MIDDSLPKLIYDNNSETGRHTELTFARFEICMYNLTLATWQRKENVFTFQSLVPEIPGSFLVALEIVVDQIANI